VFGGLATPFGRAFAGEKPAAEQLSRAMLGAWVNFARSGDPSHEVLGNWVPYESQTRHTMRLAENLDLVSDPLKTLRPFWDSLR
jgi:para-nitrobenzyl esterase